MPYSVFCIAKRECSRLESLVAFFKSSCILPAAEKTRSTPADDAGAAKYCLPSRAGAESAARRLSTASRAWARWSCDLVSQLLKCGLVTDQKSYVYNQVKLFGKKNRTNVCPRVTMTQNWHIFTA